MTHYRLFILSLALLIGGAGCGGGGSSKNNPTPGRQVWAGFQPIVTYPLGGTPVRSLSLGDINGDSHRDLITLDTTGAVKVSYWQSLGRFAAPVTVANVASPQQAVSADFDRDGHDDIIVLQKEANGFTVLRGKGDGQFFPPAFYPLPRHGRRIATRDINRDQYPDLVILVANSGSDELFVQSYLGSATGFTAAWNYHAAFLVARDMALGEVTGDNNPDIVLAFQDLDHPVWILPGNGNGTFGVPVKLNSLTPPDHEDGTNRLALGDINGDGRADIVTSHNLGSPEGDAEMVAVRPTTGNTFGGAIRMPTELPEDLLVIDVTGDEKADIITSNISSSAITCFQNQGNNRFDSGTEIPLGGPGVGPTAMVWDDFNLDGSVDVAVLNLGKGTVSVLMNAGLR